MHLRHSSTFGCLPSLLRLILILQFLIPPALAMLLPVPTPMMEKNPDFWRRQILLCIYSVRQCLPACLNGGRLWHPSMPWKKCHCECPNGFTGFVCQIPPSQWCDPLHRVIEFLAWVWLFQAHEADVRMTISWVLISSAFHGRRSNRRDNNSVAIGDESVLLLIMSKLILCKLFKLKKHQNIVHNFHFNRSVKWLSTPWSDTL